MVVGLVFCREMAGLEEIQQSYLGSSATSAASSLVSSSSSPPSDWFGGAQGVWAPGDLLEAD